ncbi:hypothetical protein [Stenotrophomonas indicatrix]|uniref:hypothetical protein n=1 Tax=Stenotrophomonas indicatrix TaxID=2045451 RepID=UPI0037367C61
MKAPLKTRHRVRPMRRKTGREQSLWIAKDIQLAEIGMVALYGYLKIKAMTTN